MGTAPNAQPIEAAPNRIWLHELHELLAWYETNLCDVDLIDPRGHKVSFSLEHFPHLIKLLQKGSDREVNKPRKQAQAIKARTKGNVDFGGYETERAQTLPCIAAIILRPTKIMELITQPLAAQKAGETLYVKEFTNMNRRYKFKVMVCRRVGKTLLVPVTSHPRDHDRFGQNYQQVWP